MGAKTSLGLKATQFLFRTIIFCCAIVALGIFSYFLAALRSRHLHVPTWSRAVEGLSGAAALYSLIGLVLLWCLAGHMLASSLAILLDILFIGAFIYVAYENRGGAGRCKSSSVRTPFGTQDYRTTSLTNTRGSRVETPRFRTLCRLETAVLAVSIIAIFFLLLAALTEIMLMRSHKKTRSYGNNVSDNHYAGNGYAGNGYAGDGYAGNGYAANTGKRRGLFGRRNKNVEPNTYNDNTLPSHAEPAQMRESYATETTAATTTPAGYDNVPLHHGQKPVVAYGNPQQTNF